LGRHKILPFYFWEKDGKKKVMDKQTQQNLLNLVKDGYEQIADDFSTTRDKKLWPELAKLAEQVKDGDSVLDAGCGNGRLVKAFIGKNITYIGIDSSEKLIKKAKMNNESRIMNKEFIIGSILDLKSILNEKFNFIFSVAVFHHLPGEELRIEALKQMKERLKDDGKIIISAWNLWRQNKYLKLILKFFWKKIIGKNKMDFGDIVFDWKNNKGEKVSPRYYHAFTKNELTKLAGKASLKIEKISKDKYNYYMILVI